MAVSIATVLLRIRSYLNEASPGFYSNLATAGLMKFYNDGAAEQHRIVIDAARQSGKLGEVQHPYLRHFSAFKPFGINASLGQMYPLPANYMEMIKLGISNIALTREVEAQRMDACDDWYAQNIPQMAATEMRPRYTFAVDTDGAVKLKIFVHGNTGGKPNGPFNGRLYYYRDVALALDTDTNVDLPDPYNEGPVWYACMQAATKAGADPSGYAGLFATATQSVIAPPAASNAIGQQAQSEQAAMATERGKTREGQA